MVRAGAPQGISRASTPIGTRMIEARRFDAIRRRHGAYASWAVWAPATDTPKSNMGDIRVLDERVNRDLLGQLNQAVVMVGLNISRQFPDEPFRNFHDPNAAANDFKLRYAFAGTQFWGAYMTDAVKGFVEPDSTKLVKHLRGNPESVRQHIVTLRAELKDLGTSKPILLAFGGATHQLLLQHLASDEYSLMISIMHYSYRISKEKYRDTVLRQIALASGTTA